MKWPTADEIGVYLEISSAILAFFVAAFHLIRDHRAKTTTDPMTVLARAGGLAILPQALIIMFGTFNPYLLCTVQGLRVFFMLSGLSLLYVCYRSVTSLKPIRCPVFDRIAAGFPHVRHHERPSAYRR